MDMKNAVKLGNVSTTIHTCGSRKVGRVL